ncbi:trigger factor [Candidatus Saccharibacteria bacterium]|nr:trigger factor [Candidatus Saccharibacteria bacterium]
MKHSISKKSSTGITLSISVDEQFISPYKQAVLKRLKKDLKVDGFRPGQAPDHIAIRQIGDDRVQAEVIEEVITHAYTRAVREQKLDTIASPKISLKKFVPYSEIEFEAEVATMPEIKFDHTKLRVKPKEVKAETKEVEETLAGMQKQMAERKPSEGPAKDGDELKIDFEGKRGGKPVEGAAAKDAAITIGDKQFIPGFEENLAGLKKGDKKTFDVTFPKDYHATELAGQKVEFSVQVHEIHNMIKPEINDDFATHVGKFKNLKELKADIEKTIKAQKEAQNAQEYENKVVDELIDKTKFDVPEFLLEDNEHRLQHEVEDNLKNSGMDLKKWLEIQNKTEDDFKKELRTEAERRVKLGILMRYIIEKEDIKVSDAEIDAEMERLRSQYSDPKMQEELTHGHFRDDLRNHMMTQKAVAKLVGYAKQ